MRGITDDMLDEFFVDHLKKHMDKVDITDYRSVMISTILALKNECTELNPWKPIDENTPKDREILLFNTNFGRIVGHYNPGTGWVDHAGYSLSPTHYQELPQPPKENKNDTPRPQII